MPPTVSWDETQPPASQAFSLGDDRIREFKKQFREIFEINHEIDSSSGSGDAWGYHNKIDFLEQSDDPANVANTIIFFTKEVDSYSELHMMDNSGSTMQLTSGSDFIGGMPKEIRMWSGTLANIPTGWSLCDGSGSKPNLIGRFIQGTISQTREPSNNYTGGNDNLSVTLPAHTHTIASSGNHDHTHKYVSGSDGGFISGMYRYGSGTGDRSWLDGYCTYASAHSHTLETKGSSTNIDHRPLYYELAFITRG